MHTARPEHTDTRQTEFLIKLTPLLVNLFQNISVTTITSKRQTLSKLHGSEDNSKSISGRGSQWTVRAGKVQSLGLSAGVSTGPVKLGIRVGIPARQLQTIQLLPRPPSLQYRTTAIPVQLRDCDYRDGQTQMDYCQHQYRISLQICSCSNICSLNQRSKLMQF